MKLLAFQYLSNFYLTLKLNNYGVNCPYVHSIKHPSYGNIAPYESRYTLFSYLDTFEYWNIVPTFKVL